MFRWRYDTTLAQLNQEFQAYLKSVEHPLAAFKTIQSLQVTQRSLGGRVLKMVVTTDRGTIELEKDDVLNAFESPASLLFYLEPLVDKNKALKGYAFVGGGLGHGVGLSQVGSYNLGKLGWTRDRILGFYFPGAQLQPIKNSITLWRDRSSLQGQAAPNSSNN